MITSTFSARAFITVQALVPLPLNVITLKEAAPIPGSCAMPELCKCVAGICPLLLRYKSAAKKHDLSLLLHHDKIETLFKFQNMLCCQK